MEDKLLPAIISLNIYYSNFRDKITASLSAGLTDPARAIADYSQFWGHHPGLTCGDTEPGAYSRETIIIMRQPHDIFTNRFDCWKV